MIDLFSDMIKVDTERGVIIVIAILSVIALFAILFAMRNANDNSSKMVKSAANSATDAISETSELFKILGEQQKPLFEHLMKLTMVLTQMTSEMRLTNENFIQVQLRYDQHSKNMDDVKENSSRLAGEIQRAVTEKIDADIEAIQKKLDELSTAVNNLAPAIHNAVKPMFDEAMEKIASIKEICNKNEN